MLIVRTTLSEAEAIMGDLLALQSKFNKLPALPVDLHSRESIWFKEGCSIFLAVYNENCVGKEGLDRCKLN